jgi:hypothetical protein
VDVGVLNWFISEVTVRTILLLSTVCVLSALVGCGGTRPLASRLPANNEIGPWKLEGRPAVLDSNTDLYNQIDGGAPQYIDRGWVAGVYATYEQDVSLVQVAIHDMGNSDNAQTLFNFHLPVSRVEIDNLPNAVVDMGLPNAYAAEAYAGQYDIEVSIDDRSDAALNDVQRFVRAILKRCE